MASDAPTPTTPATAEQLREWAQWLRDQERERHTITAEGIERAHGIAAALDAEAARREADPERELRERVAKLEALFVREVDPFGLVGDDLTLWEHIDRRMNPDRYFLEAPDAK